MESKKKATGCSRVCVHKNFKAFLFSAIEKYGQLFCIYAEDQRWNKLVLNSTVKCSSVASYSFAGTTVPPSLSEGHCSHSWTNMATLCSLCASGRLHFVVVTRVASITGSLLSCLAV